MAPSFRINKCLFGLNFVKILDVSKLFGTKIVESDKTFSNNFKNFSHEKVNSFIRNLDASFSIYTS